MNGGTVELKGTGEVGDTVDLYADGNAATIVGIGTVGALDITTTATSADGVHTFTGDRDGCGEPNRRGIVAGVHGRCRSERTDVLAKIE